MTDPSADAPRPADTDGRALIIIPTYNEAENLPRILERVRSAVPAVDVLVVDDGSPDGTGRIADDLAAADPAVYVLHRTRKEGLGAAYVEGFGWAIGHGYDTVVEMDADGSHAPEQLPDLFTALPDADLVIGSRWVPGGRIVNWPWHRSLISRAGNLYIRLVLAMPVRDATAGYRVYRRAVLEKAELAEVSSQGYCFQVDLTWRAYQDGFRIVEVPITFTERESGQSKMSPAIVREAFWRVLGWGVRYRLGIARRTVRRALGRAKG